jgi:hypothetical protein
MKSLWVVPVSAVALHFLGVPTSILFGIYVAGPLYVLGAAAAVTVLMLGWLFVVSVLERRS